MTVIVRAGQGPASWMVGDTYTYKATTETTGGAFTLIEASIPPGSGPPPHTHTLEDEAFYLLDGELDVLMGGETVRAGAGDFLYLPRRVAHGFRNPGVGAARALIIVTPAGFERFFQEVGVAARPGEQAPPFDPADVDRFAETIGRYGVQIHLPKG